jgi:hypothetical protein
MGRILLNHDKEQGIDFIRKAMELDADATLDGCTRIINYLESKGRKDDACPLTRAGFKRGRGCRWSYHARNV